MAVVKLVVVVVEQMDLILLVAVVAVKLAVMVVVVFVVVVLALVALSVVRRGGVAAYLDIECFKPRACLAISSLLKLAWDTTFCHVLYRLKKTALVMLWKCWSVKTHRMPSAPARYAAMIHNAGFPTLSNSCV